MKRILSSVKKLRAGIARSFPVTITLSAVLLSVTLNMRAAWFAKFDGVDGSASWAGDVDGDGRGDVGMIRAGAYMSGIQDASGNFTWTAPRSIGTTNVSGATIGHLLDPNRFALAVTSPDINRINIFDLTPGASGVPVSVFLPSIGPNVVVATDIGGVGNTAHEDFFITSILNSGAPNRFTTLRNTGGASFPEIQDEVMISFEHGNAVVLKLNDPQIVGVMERGGVTDTFRGLSFASGVMQNIISLAGLPRGSEFLYGNFGGTALSRFLFYRPGESNLLVSAVQEPVPGTFTFGALSTFQMGHALEFVAALPGAQPGEIRHKFFAIVDRSQLARVYDFDGTNAPTVVQTFAPAEGEIFFGGIGIGNNDFMIFSRPAIGGQLTAGHKFAVHRHVNGAYVPGQTGALPMISALSHAANVFEFRFEPFVNAVPNLLRSLDASDWSSLFMLNGNP
ncbi:MAG TPA: hypothetical protein VNT99_18130, partial [Methylomirabilota bacterium]|nr:hypothetical protein [Methylomirabilota bacterium]